VGASAQVKDEDDRYVGQGDIDGGPDKGAQMLCSPDGQRSNHSADEGIDHQFNGSAGAKSDQKGDDPGDNHGELDIQQDGREHGHCGHREKIGCHGVPGDRCACG